MEWWGLEEKVCGDEERCGLWLTGPRRRVVLAEPGRSSRCGSGGNDG